MLTAMAAPAFLKKKWKCSSCVPDGQKTAISELTNMRSFAGMRKEHARKRNDEI